jgi:hypothetical protein
MRNGAFLNDSGQIAKCQVFWLIILLGSGTPEHASLCLRLLFQMPGTRSLLSRSDFGSAALCGRISVLRLALASLAFSVVVTSRGGAYGGRVAGGRAALQSTARVLPEIAALRMAMAARVRGLLD